MGIELGSMGSAVGGVATVVGRGISGLGKIGGEVPPALGLTSGPASLEGFVAMGKAYVANIDLTGGRVEPNFNMGGEIIFAAKPALNEVEVKKLAPEAVKPQAEAVWEVVLPQVEPITKPDQLVHVHTLVRSYTSTELNPSSLEKPVSKIQPVVETKTDSQPAQSVVVAPQVALQEEIVEVVEQQQKVEKPQEVWEEEIVKGKKIIVKDEEAAAQRNADIKTVTKKAAGVVELLGLKKITGSLLKKLMPKEYAGVRGEVVKEQGSDGSYQELLEGMSELGEFGSETEATETTLKIAEEKKPGKWAEDGTPLTVRDIVRIFRGRFIKPVQVYTEVVKRVTKKKLVASQSGVVTPAPVVTEKATEPTIKDFPELEGVFPQAA